MRSTPQRDCEEPREKLSESATHKRSVIFVDPTVVADKVPDVWPAKEERCLQQLAVTVLTASLSGEEHPEPACNFRSTSARGTCIGHWTAQFNRSEC